MDSLRESEIEKVLCDKVSKMGGMAVKLVSAGFSGMPDRLLLMKGARALFVELKRPGAKPRPLQLIRHKSLRALGFEVFVVDSLEKVQEVVNAIQGA